MKKRFLHSSDFQRGFGSEQLDPVGFVQIISFQGSQQIRLRILSALQSTSYLPRLYLLLRPSLRDMREPRDEEEHATKETMFQKTAEVVSEEALYLTVKEEVVEIVKQKMEEIQLVESSSVVVMDKYITEFVLAL